MSIKNPADFPPATETTFGVIAWHDFVCPQHGPYRKVETGYLGHGYLDNECPVCRDERLHRELVENYQDEEWHKQCDSIGVPARFRAYALDSFRCTEDGQAKAVETCRKWVEGAVTNLLLHGRPGTGKTHLLCASLREAVIAGHTARFIAEDDLFRTVKETYGGKSAMSESQVLSYFGDVDYLAIDDMGRSRWSAEESAILMRIINRRYNLRKSTAISTNLLLHATEQNGKILPGLSDYLGEGVMRRLEPGRARIVASWKPYQEEV